MRGGVDRTSSSEALCSWFEPHSISKDTTSLPRSPRGSSRSRAHPQISQLSEMGGVIPKNKSRADANIVLQLPPAGVMKSAETDIIHLVAMIRTAYWSTLKTLSCFKMRHGSAPLPLVRDSRREDLPRVRLPRHHEWSRPSQSGQSGGGNKATQTRNGCTCCHSHGKHTTVKNIGCPLLMKMLCNFLSPCMFF